MVWANLLLPLTDAYNLASCCMMMTRNQEDSAQLETRIMHSLRTTAHRMGFFGEKLVCPSQLRVGCYRVGLRVNSPLV